MNVVLLSGGSGKRLWPLTNEVRAKQFIPLFKNERNEYESMIQSIIRKIKEVDETGSITIVTNKKQISSIQNQISQNYFLAIEPTMKGTFLASLLAASYLADVERLDKEEVITICPVDSFASTDFYQLVNKASKMHKLSGSNLTLIGIKPTYPSEKYGYILRENEEKVRKFFEKPIKQMAETLIQKNALWNSGIIICKLSYLLEMGHKSFDFEDYYDLIDKYDTLKASSFDKILEKEENMKVWTYDGNWHDLGTWNTFTGAMSEKAIGNVVLNENCMQTHIINELNLPILCMGVNNVIIAASPEGILVSDKQQSSYIEPYVEEINNQIMFAEKSWGSFKVIDVQQESLTILVTLRPGNKMKYHSHNYRDEVWTIVAGYGKTIVDGMEQLVKPGDVVTIQAGCRHMIIATTELKVIEVQIGKEINVNDKCKYELE